MNVETKLVLSACCNTIVIHEVLCCWEVLAAGSWGRPDLGCSNPGCAPLCWGIAWGQLCWMLRPLTEQPSPLLLLFESLSMLFIERMSFLSCKRLLGGYSQNSQDLLWCLMLVEMLHSLLSHADKLRRAELPFGAAVDGTSTSFAYVWGIGDFLF